MSDVAKPPVTLTSGNPLKVLEACRRVARKADWRLEQWDSFRGAASRCFSAEAQPEEHHAFMAIVRAHFDVTLASSFSDDPSQWRGHVAEAAD